MSPCGKRFRSRNRKEAVPDIRITDGSKGPHQSKRFLVTASLVAIALADLQSKRSDL
ncbi:MAG: hypothetical protein PVS2B2_26980 [Candidatus Acidiferrum sp.]